MIAAGLVSTPPVGSSPGAWPRQPRPRPQPRPPRPRSEREQGTAAPQQHLPNPITPCGDLTLTEATPLVGSHVVNLGWRPCGPPSAGDSPITDLCERSVSFPFRGG